MYQVKIDIRKEDSSIVSMFEGQDLITIDDMLDKLVELWEDIETKNTEIEELGWEIDDLKEEIRHIEQDREDNYRPIPPEEMYDIHDRDFI